jgi:pSer/pThr/pTyr-binding forkhead associated (FHA) protein
MVLILYFLYCPDEEDVVFDADEGHTPSPKVREIEESWPPCLRLVVVSSEKMASGQVFMITKVGSDIGREVSERSGVRIKDVYVSKLHASVSFDEEEELFYIKDCGSVCGTFVNGRRLSDVRTTVWGVPLDWGTGQLPGEFLDKRLTNFPFFQAKERSCLHPLVHGDTVAMGTSTFSVHIHKGLDVCNDCLPQPTISKGKSLYESVQCLEKERVETMDVLKRQYGLKGPQRQDPRSQPTHYHNRAEERRRLHGSEPLMSEPMSTTQASSLQRPIESSNLGHQLLSKMGWEEGRGLGRDGKGPTEPMVVVTRDPSAGLGSEHSSAILGEGSRSERSRRMLKRLNDARYQLPTDNKRTQVWVRGSITKFKRQ